MLSIADAYREVLARVAPLPGRCLPLEEVAGLVLAETVRADIDAPPFDKSTVDGFAVRSADLAGPEERALTVVEEILAAPRLSTPRKRIAAGSVGIAERQTAAYPVVSPGGWNLIGRTPCRLFGRDIEGYSLLQPGDRVRFVPIERAEFIRLGGDDSPLEASQ